MVGHDGTTEGFSPKSPTFFYFLFTVYGGIFIVIWLDCGGKGSNCRDVKGGTRGGEGEQRWDGMKGREDLLLTVAERNIRPALSL